MKNTTAIMLAGLSLFMVPVSAGAAPVSVAGEVSVKYEQDKDNLNHKTSGSMYTLKVKGERDLGAGWSLYARLGAQYATEPSLADFNLEAYQSDRKSVIALDQFGVNYKTDNFSYKIGRQDAAVGTTALLYSRADSNVGKHSFVDGLSAAGKIGAVEVTTLFAQEDNNGAEDNKVYAIHAGYSVMDNLNWGITLGRYQDRSNGNTNHWAVDGTYKFGKSTLTAEYTRSSRSGDNKAYAATWNYDINNKTAVYLTNFKVENNGDMGKQSDFDNDNKGFYYGITHKLDEADALELTYKDQKVISTGEKNKKLELTFSRAF